MCIRDSTERFYIGNNESSNSYLYLGSPSGQNNNVALTVGGSTKLTAFSGGIGVNGDLELQDTIYHAGDTDTKIRFPAADTFSVETGGSTRLHIHSDGRFRVGTTSQPSGTVSGFQLDMGSYPGTMRLMSGAGASGTQTAGFSIGGSNHNASIENGANSGAQVNLYNYNSTDGNSSAVSFMNSSGLSASRILGLNVSHSSRTGALVFMTSSGSHPTEKLRIDSSGRLYIGATSGGNADNDDLVISGSGKKGMTICSTDGSETRLVFADGLSGTNAVVGQVLYDHSENRMDFYTSTNRRVSIDNSSRLMVGTIIEGHENADTLTLSNSGTAGMTIRSTSSNCHIYFSDATSGAGEYVGQLGYNHGSDYMFFHTGGSERLRANSSGITVTGTVDSASDVILKENIKTIDNALDKVTKLRGVEYDYKDNKKHSIGVIAQEVEEVLPELVNGSEQKSVAYGNIAAVLIEAIKEQNEVINKMKKEIEDLKG